MNPMPFKETRIHTIIPDGKSPESILLDPDGHYPNDIYDPEKHQTIENVVHDIGRRLGTHALAVTMREQNHPDGGIVYRTKPLPDNISLPEGYSWQHVTKADA